MQDSGVSQATSPVRERSCFFLKKSCKIAKLWYNRFEVVRVIAAADSAYV